MSLTRLLPGPAAARTPFTLAVTGDPYAQRRDWTAPSWLESAWESVTRRVLGRGRLSRWRMRRVLAQVRRWEQDWARTQPDPVAMNARVRRELGRMPLSEREAADLAQGGWQNPEIRQRFAASGVETIGSTPQALAEDDRVLLWGWAWEGAQRTAELVAEACDRAYDAYWREPDGPWLAQHSPDLDNIRVALDWCCGRDEALGVREVEGEAR